MPASGDPRRARRNRTRHAARLAAEDPLGSELADRLLDHLEGLRIEPQRILVLGGGGGLLRAQLVERFPAAALVYADPAAALLAAMPRASRLQRWFGTAREPLRIACLGSALPLRNGSVGLAIVLGLPGFEPLEPVLEELRRVLAADGLLLFHALGPDSLREWRQALQAAHPGHDPLDRSVLRLVDMHDLADAASHAGLASPVVDMEYLTVHYPDLATLLGDLRGAGGGNALAARPRGLVTPRQRARLLAALEALRTPQGLPLTLEVIYGHAWNTRPLVDDQGRPVIPIRAAR